jgi:transglutaminase-like putative cysteine protease
VTDLDPRAVAVGTLLVAGSFAVALLGPVAAVAAGLAVAVVLGAPVVRRVGQHPVSRGAALLLGAALLAASAWGSLRGEVLGTLLSLLTIHRVGARTLLADRVPLALSTLSLLVAVAGRDDALVLGPVLLHAVLLPVALLSTRPGWRGAAGFSASGSILAAVVFVVAPRVTSTTDAELTGFSEAVELGAMDALLDDPTVVFRARVTPDAAATPVWRGRALDSFDGHRWSAPEVRAPVEVVGPRLLPPDAHVVEIEVEEPGVVVFTAGRVVDVRTDGTPLSTDARSGFRAEGARRWRLVALPPLGVDAQVAWGDEPGDLDASLALPPGMDPRVAELAAAVAGEGPPALQLERLAAHLRTSYTYTRTPRDRGDDAPLTTFLFERRAGHCEYFASALAVLARTRGIPTRVVNGYTGGSPRPDGWLEIRGSDAHAWVEAWVDGAWRGVDATPGPSAARVVAPAWTPPLSARVSGWYRTRFLRYGRREQLGALVTASRWIEGGRAVADRAPWRGLLVLAGVGVAGALLVRRVLRRTVPLVLDPRAPVLDAVARAHLRAREGLAAGGLRPPVSLPPVDAAEWAVRERPGPDTEALLELAWLLYEVHLGGADPRAAAPRARTLADKVVRPVTDG